MKIKIAIFALFASSQMAAAQDAPPNAQPGKCYAKCLIPDQYEIVESQRKLVKAGGFTEWREVLCGEKVTGNTIRKIQDALRKFDKFEESIDGVMNASTKAALTKFQKENGLPVGNLDVETLSALGIHY